METPFTLPDSLAPAGAATRAPYTSASWRNYFRANAAQLLDIPWEFGIRLNDAEREAVAASVQEFQLGESSEGKHLMTRAIRHAADTGDVDYIPALRLFIAEEHRHARDLGRVLDLAGIPRVGRTWPDSVFRRLRKGAGLELSIAVLVTAEIIAKVYYAALREATHAPVLRRLCDQILADEVQHVRFQTERVAILRHGKSRPSIRLRTIAHRLFLAGTCLVVWHKHGRAMRAGGYGLLRFWRQTFCEMREALRRMDPTSYVWERAPFPRRRPSQKPAPAGAVVGTAPATVPARPVA